MTKVDPTALKDIAFDPLEKRMRGTTAHGNVYFDVPFITHIDGNLSVGGCEWGLVLPKNIKHVVSLYRWERYHVTHNLRSFTEIEMFDSTEPGQNAKQILDIAKWAKSRVDDASTLIHCQAGLNRSNLIAATVLMLDGATGREAIDLLRSKRGPAVLCNPAFEEMILKGLILEVNE